MGDHKLILEAEKDFDGDDFDAAIKAAILKRNKKHKSSASADAKEEPIESPKASASESGHGKDEGDSSPPAKSTPGPAGGDDSEYAHELFTHARPLSLRTREHLNCLPVPRDHTALGNVVDAIIAKEPQVDFGPGLTLHVIGVKGRVGVEVANGARGYFKCLD